MPTIDVGSPAPAFTLRDSHGKKHALADFKGRPVVIYFYPEDDTPLCTTQACQFRDAHPDFSNLNCQVIGISPDDAAAHAAFAVKFKLPFLLLVDDKLPSGEPKISTLYGAWGDKNMYGNIVRSTLRTTYLIGPDGKVAHRWDRVKTPGHAAKVLAAVKQLLEPSTDSEPRSAGVSKKSSSPRAEKRAVAKRRPAAKG